MERLSSLHAHFSHECFPECSKMSITSSFITRQGKLSNAIYKAISISEPSKADKSEGGRAKRIWKRSQIRETFRRDNGDGIIRFSITV